VVSSINKTDRLDITEISLKVALNTTTLTLAKIKVYKQTRGQLVTLSLVLWMGMLTVTSGIGGKS